MTAHLLHDDAPEPAFDASLFDAKANGRFTCNDPLARVRQSRLAT